MKSKNSLGGRLSVLIATGLAWGLHWTGHTQDVNLATDYRNYWVVPNLGDGPYEFYFDTNSPASTAVFGGSVLDNSTNQTALLPNDGRRYGLLSSSLGQPAVSVVSDVAIGDAITPPPGFASGLPPANFKPVVAGAGTNVSYYVSPNGGAIYVPSKNQVIAAQPNNVEIVWTNRVGGVGFSRTQVINVSAVSTRRPSKLFWTEAPYDVTPVNLGGLFPVIHYNSEVPPPTFLVDTNGVTNYLSGVWLDAQKQLRAINTEGVFLIEYYVTGSYDQQVPGIGVEVVRVLAPEIQIVDSEMGERLLPTDSFWGETDGIAGVIPDTSRSASDTVLVYGQQGPKLNWAFPKRRTWMDPWALEVIWKQTGLMGVQWPYEVDWYSVDWPDHPQIYVIGDNGAADQATVVIPNSLTAQVLTDMDPPLHARLSDSGKSFAASEPGLSMIQYENHTNIWFDVIRSVSHTNSAHFNLEPVEWEIGRELIPGDEQAHALALDGIADYVEIQDAYLNKRNAWSLSFWFSAERLAGATLLSEGSESGPAFNLNLTGNGQLEVEIWNQGSRHEFTTTAAPLASNRWQYVAVTYSNGGAATGTLSVYVDGYVESTDGVPRVSFDGDDRTLLGGQSSSPVAGFFAGKLDEYRIWSVALNSDELAELRLDFDPAMQNDLVAWFPMDEGEGYVLNNEAGDKRGAVMGNPTWTYGQVIPDEELWNGFPGYVHRAEGTRYHVGYYDYPGEDAPDRESHVFAVNTGELEVWWASQSRNTDMPPVYYPSRVVRYTNSWPSNPSQIVIASGMGSSMEQAPTAEPWDASQALAPSIYHQNDPALDGYNPNEEHALLLDGVIYALRDDLGTASSSQPFVLVNHTDAASGLPDMHVFQVVETNTVHQFERDLTAGLPIVPILPLGAFPPASSTTSDQTPPAWQDRNLEWWAVAAGDDSGPASTVMRFWYAMQPGFWFPALDAADQPAVGTEVPWLSGSDSGTPVAFTYQITWPTNVAKLRLGQTLTVAQNGLPDVWDQLSAEVAYEQSQQQTPPQFSTVLFDPVVDHRVNLDGGVIDALTGAQEARIDVASGQVRFPNLPPSLYPRLFYDRSTSELVLEGERIETLTGSGYLLLNMLDGTELAQIVAIAAGIDSQLRTSWQSAVSALPSGVTLIDPNLPYVKAALGARLTEGTGYVTLAFNNSTNQQQVPPALPVSLSIIQVDTNLYSGELEVIAPEDVLAEQLSLRLSPDFAGRSDLLEYRWKWVDPVGGLPPPNISFDDWNTYGGDPVAGTNEVTIAGASPFTLADHYFAVQYRPANTNGPSGDAWSDWTSNLAPGWVVRAMTGINPFMQVYQDMLDHAVDTRATMISQAGGPYEGDIALNLDAASEAGLIPTYETIFQRAKEFSLLVGIADDDINQTLLFAAGRLNDLYNLLGNEAYADAQDPMISYPASLRDSGSFLGANGASLFAFMNQVPDALGEELALLRGRDDTLLPAVTTSPIYNRLIWNFTQGINAGEPAYAYLYDIRGNPDRTDGVITAEDAKRLYPQGHGDAWGHYLSAIRKYYDLLAYPIFKWNTEPGATLLGNVPVVTDFLDEQKFAETAAARARTGAQIVQQTFRQLYVEESEGDWPGYQDSNTNRAWGIAGWASRAGQAALYDWAAANSLMLTTLTNLTQISATATNRPPEGIEKIDRDSTPELHEIAAQYRLIQQNVDNANGGLNPLGMVRGSVPFDIDPSAVDAGETHFEQIYDRAEQALLNAVVAYDFARGGSTELANQFDSVYDLAETLSANETDYHNRLIGIFGYPYSDDIGPTGTYPQGYDGPDLINWQIVDIENLVATVPTNTQTLELEIYDLGFTANSDFTSTDYTDYTGLTGTRTSNQVARIHITVNDDGLKVKPDDWTGSRRAQGELQLAISDYIQAWYGLEAGVREYEQMMEELEDDIEHRVSDFGRLTDSWKQRIDNLDAKTLTSKVVSGLSIGAEALELATDISRRVALHYTELEPNSLEGLVGIQPAALIFTDAPESLAATIVEVVEGSQYLAARAKSFGAEGRDLAQELKDLKLEELNTNYENRDELRWETAELEIKLQSQYVKLAALQSQVQAVEQSYQRIQNLLAEGQRLFFERGQVRSRAAQRIQTARYADLNFRIYRNDALRLYQSTFDLAARYVYMAAKAYDYETGLLSSDTDLTPGSQFLEDVVRARLPGSFSSWLSTPMPASSGSGDPGLADILARMKADWNVVKGRFGFNNPDTETSRFSLRTELFRTAPDESGDAAWAQTLENSVVPDLNQLSEFRRYCRPFSGSTNVEPGMVITFPSYVMARRNFFGLDLAGGDNAYDASHAATKIRSVGVWFTDYNNANGAAGALANEPRVYLVPAGLDVMRSPTGDATQTRSYTVFDQAIPLPYDVGEADMDNPDWSPVIDSLQEPFGQMRQFASFRAYHDSGDFDPSETITASRLIGRSVWNTKWMLIIPGSTLLQDPEEGIERFIYGALVNGTRDGKGVKDIKIFFQTYSISGD